MQEIARDIIEQAALGDIGAFEEVYKTFSSTVYTLALGVTKNRQDAQEVTQDVFIKIFRSLKSFKFGSSLGTWIYRVAVNTALNMYRARSRRASAMTYIEDAGDIPDASGKSPDEAVVLKDSEARAAKLLKGLSPEHRACIMMREIEGLDYKEMSKALGVPLNTVRSRLKRARQALIAIVKTGGHAS
jgi:RNA polymerase sigma-70 factor (ECF subfamily)